MDGACSIAIMGGGGGGGVKRCAAAAATASAAPPAAATAAGATSHPSETVHDGDHAQAHPSKQAHTCLAAGAAAFASRIVKTCATTTPATTSTATTSPGYLCTATASALIPAPADLVYALVANPLPGPVNGVARVLRRRVLADGHTTTTVEVEHVAGGVAWYTSVPARHHVRCHAGTRTVAWTLAAQGAMRRWDRVWRVEAVGEGACRVSVQQTAVPAHAPPAPLEDGPLLRALSEAAVRQLVRAVAQAAAGAMRAVTAAATASPHRALASPPPPLPAWVAAARLPPAAVAQANTLWEAAFAGSAAAQPALDALAQAWATGLADLAAWAVATPPPAVVAWRVAAALTGLDAAVAGAGGGAHRPPACARATWAALERVRTVLVAIAGADGAVLPPPPPPASPHWLARPIRPTPPAAAAALASHPLARRPRRDAELTLERRWHTLVVEGGRGGWPDWAARARAAWPALLVLLSAVVLAACVGGAAAAVGRGLASLLSPPAPPPAAPPPPASLVYAIAVRDRLAAWARAAGAGHRPPPPAREWERLKQWAAGCARA